MSQIPVFICAVLGALSVVEMRGNAPWAAGSHDLSPDQLYFILPLLMAMAR